MKNLSGIFTTVYVVIMFAVFPLYYRDSYLDILEAKTRFFSVVTLIYIVGYLLIKAYLCVKLRTGKDVYRQILSKRNSSNPFMHVKNHTLSDILSGRVWFAVLLMAALLFSFAASADWENALWGTDGRLFGAVVIFLCMASWFCIADSEVKISAVIWSGLAGACLVSVFTIANRYGFDPLNMYASIDESQIGDYLGTMGQKNIESGFLGIFLTFSMGVFIWENSVRGEEESSKISLKYSIVSGRKYMYAAAVFLIVCAGICTNSDSFFLALAGCLVFYLWFAAKNKNAFRVYISVYGIIAAAMLFLKLFDEATGWRADWEETHYILIEEFPWIIVLLASAAIVFIFGKVKENLFEKYAGKIFRIFIAAEMILLCIWIVYLNFAAENPQEKLGAEFFYFSDSWGTNRGYVWKHTLELYKNLPLPQKIIGVGPAGFSQFFSEYFIDSVMQFGYYFEDAHSELFQFLVILGAAGVIGYYGMLISCMVSGIKSGKNTGKLMLAGVLFVSALVGMVNNPLVFTTPYVFIFMGLASGKDSSGL